jgi:hypothetical protein
MRDKFTAVQRQASAGCGVHAQTIVLFAFAAFLLSK